jgi:hypothetical protein
MSNAKGLQGRETLFTTMFGSRLYGTNTPTSDIDWKEIFLPEKTQLLIGRKPVNIVVSTGSDHSRNTKDDVDYEYIPIQVFANDFIGGQTYAVELAFAVLANEHDYGKAGQELYSMEFLDFVFELTEKFLTSNIKAMIGYAMNQAQIYGIKGTRLASVRKFVDKLNEVIDSGTCTRDDKLAMLEDWTKVNGDKYMFMTTFKNMDNDLPGISVLEKIYPLSITIGEALDRTTALKEKYGSRAQDAEQAKGMDWKATAHAVRITKQAIKLLSTGAMEFPFPEDEVKFLLSIKHGERSVEEVKVILEELFDELDRVKETTKLPERTPQMDEQFEMWLKGWMSEFYH